MAQRVRSLLTHRLWVNCCPGRKRGDIGVNCRILRWWRERGVVTRYGVPGWCARFHCWGNTRCKNVHYLLELLIGCDWEHPKQAAQKQVPQLARRSRLFAWSGW